MTTRRRVPWVPTAPEGPYRLPRGVQDRLETALAGYRNREACFALATFLGRFWSVPSRLVASFPIDRRALCDHAALGLTEARVRGAIATLVEVGFLDRIEPVSGRRYQRTPEGLNRRPILFRFGSEYGTIFAHANGAARRVRGTPAPARRPIARPEPSRPPAANVAPPRAMPSPQLAQKQTLGGSRMIMGEKRDKAPESNLDAALERWRRAIEGGSAS
ncbi:hypothetical protein [Methylobacterium nonmethylotrophicum]|uniref:Uncharacterized protein n=1 Tax=Methylobacterium nonmethylotrophicum TaxID=1141884 RepID=A0A4Z0NCH9_9HYPH|nr:hypothetical protein [Methylobacterium nonmethylotrophicum]TGD91918.1 hypothetical protein EU555_35420 [Methylobacterium nonmethylotrophicum]